MKTVIEVFPQFQTLGVLNRQIVAGLFIRRKVHKHEILLQQNQVESSIRIIEAGVFRHAKATGPAIANIGLFRPGQIVSNHYSWLNGTESIFRVEALTQGYIWEISKPAYNRITGAPAAGSHDLEMALRCILLEQIYIQTHRSYIEMARSQHTMECYEYLLRQEGYILMHTPLMYLADFLGVTQSTLSRIRRDMMVKEKSLNTK